MGTQCRHSAECRDEALGEDVCSGGSDRRSGNPETLGANDLCEGAGELGVSIAYQEMPTREGVAEGHDQVAGLLGDPGPLAWAVNPAAGQDGPHAVIYLDSIWDNVSVQRKAAATSRRGTASVLALHDRGSEFILFWGHLYIESSSVGGSNVCRQENSVTA
jgi:hypothetical protein